MNPLHLSLVLGLGCLTVTACGQKQGVVPVPSLQGPAAPSDPADPPARDVRDLRDHLTFRLPAGWNLTTRDGEVSTFRLDARTAPRTSQLRYVASIAFNPYPMSTFSGAFVYLSSTPHTGDAACAVQTSTPPMTKLDPATIDNVTFTRGKDERGGICTEARSVAYTAVRQGACLRLDLVINTFCGGAVSGAQEMTKSQLGNVYQRLEDIIQSIRFTR